MERTERGGREFTDPARAQEAQAGPNDESMLQRTLDRGPYITSWELAAGASDAIVLQNLRPIWAFRTLPLNRVGRNG